MQQIRSFAEAERILAGYIPQVQELLGKDLTLERMSPLMKKLGHPENKVKLVHVAGTSGKTSTCYYLAGLLQAAGNKVGLTVSPHIDTVAERVQVNLEPIAEAEFCDNLAELLELIKAVEPRPTYFELLIAFVYWYFAKINVDYAVIETGLGGSFDATNVANTPNKVCVITDIGLDHMHVLGTTTTQIAGQKAGIIHPGNQVFMYRQQTDVDEVVGDYAAKQGATMHFVEQPAYGVNTLPLYQQRNWQLAKVIYDFVAKRDGLQPLNKDQLAKNMTIQVPGRMDVIEINGQPIIMDGAHNEQKTEAFVKSFQSKYPGQKAAVLLSLKKGKEYEAVLPLLKPICSKLILTAYSKAQDLPTPATNPNLLAQAAREIGFKNIEIEPDDKKAFEILMKSPEENKVVTGSFYLISNLRKAMLKK